MLKTTSNIIRKLTAVLLALVIAVGLLPAPALAAEKNLPEWHFLFAVIKNVDADCTDENGTTSHRKCTIPKEQIERDVKVCAQDFEKFMNASGVMRAHVDVVEIDKTVTETDVGDDIGAWINVRQSEPLLKDVNLAPYDFVFCISSLNEKEHFGNTLGEYKNGAGYAYIDLYDWEIWQKYEAGGYISPFHAGMYSHEFLHFMERLSARFGGRYSLHAIGDLYAANTVEERKKCQYDIMRNCAKGDHGTGVDPRAWQYPTHVFRTTYEWTFPSDITNIGAYAFWDCIALTKTTIPGNVKTLGTRAFSGCTSLTKITIPGSVKTLGYGAFSKCTGLTEVNILSGAAAIGDWAFEGCTGLTKITIPGSVKTLGYSAFSECTGLTEVNILSGAATIGDWAFGFESGKPSGSLSRVFIPASVTSIGEAAFYRSGVKDVYYGGTEAQWKAIKIGEYNEALSRATVHYNSKPKITSAKKGASDIRIENGCAVGSVALNIQNEGDPSELSVYIGCYDTLGRMLGAEHLGTAARAGENTLTLQLSGVIKCKNETGLQFRAFLLDSKFSPLCEAIPINQ